MYSIIIIIIIIIFIGYVWLHWMIGLHKSFLKLPLTGMRKHCTVQDELY